MRVRSIGTTALLEQTTQSQTPLLERCERATRDGLHELELSVTAQVMLQAVDESRPVVKLHHRGRVLLARPLDTRRLVLAMAPHLCFN